MSESNESSSLEQSQAADPQNAENESTPVSEWPQPAADSVVRQMQLRLSDEARRAERISNMRFVG